MTSLLALLLAAFLGALGPGPDQAGSGPVGVGDADLVLLVSNQSFDDPAASLSVDIDGRTVVAQRFDVEAQHTWIEFPLAVGPGRHTLVAESDAGHRFRQTFALPGEGRRWAVVDYWADDDHLARPFTWRMDDRPLAFD